MLLTCKYILRDKNIYYVEHVNIQINHIILIFCLSISDKHRNRCCKYTEVLLRMEARVPETCTGA